MRKTWMRIALWGMLLMLTAWAVPAGCMADIAPALPTFTLTTNKDSYAAGETVAVTATVVNGTDVWYDALNLTVSAPDSLFWQSGARELPFSLLPGASRAHEVFFSTANALPPTGDAFSPLVWAALLALSGAAGLIAFSRRARRGKAAGRALCVLLALSLAVSGAPLFAPRAQAGVLDHITLRKTITVAGKSIEITATLRWEEPLYIESAQQTGPRTILVDFNKPLTGLSPAANHFSLSGSTIAVQSTAAQTDPDKLQLTLSADLNPTASYTLLWPMNAARRQQINIFLMAVPMAVWRVNNGLIRVYFSRALTMSEVMNANTELRDSAGTSLHIDTGYEPQVPDYINIVTYSNISYGSEYTFSWNGEDNPVQTRANVAGARQIARNKVKLTFNGEGLPDEAKVLGNYAVCDIPETTRQVPSGLHYDEAENAVTLTLADNLPDSKNMIITLTVDGSAIGSGFTSTNGTVVILAVEPMSIPLNRPTTIYFILKDTNGVELERFDSLHVPASCSFSSILLNRGTGQLTLTGLDQQETIYLTYNHPSSSRTISGRFHITVAQ